MLATDRPYAHAVYEDAAAYFDPLSPDDFTSQVDLLLTDAECRSQLVSRGHALIKRQDKIDPYRGMLEKVVEVAESISLRRNREQGPDRQR